MSQEKCKERWRGRDPRVDFIVESVAYMNSNALYLFHFITSTEDSPERLQSNDKTPQSVRFVFRLATLFRFNVIYGKESEKLRKNFSEKLFRFEEFFEMLNNPASIRSSGFEIYPKREKSWTPSEPNFSFL